MSALLDTTRALFGPAPRALPVRDHLEPPRWMKKGDPLRKSYVREAELMTRGDLTFGYVVQANAALFRCGETACPAQVVYAARASDHVSVDALAAAARSAMARKGTTPEDPALARVARVLTDEDERHAPLELPDAITRGVPMKLAVVMVHPKAHLPCNYLATCALPLVVSPDRNEAAVLPVRHWGPELVTSWLDLGAHAS